MVKSHFLYNKNNIKMTLYKRERVVYNEVFNGQNVNSLLAFSRKLQCPSKMEHFIWHIFVGCLPVIKIIKNET